MNRLIFFGILLLIINMVAAQDTMNQYKFKIFVMPTQFIFNNYSTYIEKDIGANVIGLNLAFLQSTSNSNDFVFNVPTTEYFYQFGNFQTHCITFVLQGFI